jgi:hypothetical protein
MPTGLRAVHNHEGHIPATGAEAAGEPGKTHKHRRKPHQQGLLRFRCAWPPDLRDSAVNMTALQARWPVVLAKAHLLLSSSGIENYCRRPFHSEGRRTLSPVGRAAAPM